MPDRWRDVLARICLTAAALLPYRRLLTFSSVFVTDDYFASDIFNGELPGRALAGRLLHHGEFPVWTSQLCSGIPLAGLPADPLSVLTFGTLPPAAALDLFIVVLLLVAAHGAYGLARRLGADRPGAFLAGVAFAGCGYFATQLKHLSIVATVAWLPVGLLLLDRVFSAEPRGRARRACDLGLFGLVFAQQALSGFPQSAYYCALVYAGFALFRAIEHRRAMGAGYGWTKWLLIAAVAIGLGTASGAVVLLPLQKLGEVSDRALPPGWSWAVGLSYWPRNALMFLVPYATGDIANNTYTGPLFWEVYGYLGLLPFLLAIYGAVADRRRNTTKLLILITLLAYACVLGRYTPVFRIAYVIVPGMRMFRFPTRFLIVVELGLALLGAIGLTRLGAALRRRWPAPSPLPFTLAWLVVVLTIVDLSVYQPRQNPVVAADAWLAPPPTVGLVTAATTQPRTFTPHHRDFHRQAFERAHGWADVEPYFDARDLLEPNTGGGFWGVASGDCYAGISARWYVDVWGDHNRESSIASPLAALDFDARELVVQPGFATFLRTYGVTHVLSPFPQRGALLPLVGRAGSAYVYRVDDSARARFVPSAVVVKDDKEAAADLVASDFDPRRTILLDDAPAGVGGPGAASTSPSTATVVREDQRQIAVAVTAPADGFLLLADTYYPGWTVTVDGRPAPLYRANVSERGVPVPPGAHTVMFHYDPPGVTAGAVMSVVAILLLVVWVIAASILGWRSRRGDVQ